MQRDVRLWSRPCCLKGLSHSVKVRHPGLRFASPSNQPLCADGCYLLFDCPGQVELFTLHDSLLAILAVMDKQWHFR